MVEELFRQDAYLKQADATVTAVEDRGVRLDRTIFYPTGGGQPGDSGVLRWDGGEAKIVDSVKADGGDVLHVLAPGAPWPTVGTKVQADLDWDRRYRHMRMHTALHLLSAVLAYPNRPLDPAKLPIKLDLGGMTAIVENHPGHSGTDLIVRVPEQKVVYAGDLLFDHMYPVAFDEQATVSGWRSTLKTFLSYERDTIFVPGHGQVAGRDAVQLSVDLFDDIAAQAEKMYKAGVPAEDAADQYVVPDKYKDVAIFAWNFSIGPMIIKLYKEWSTK